MADESNRDDQLRKAFTKVRERVRGALRSRSAAPPAVTQKESGVAQEQTAPEPPRHEEPTQEVMDAAKARTWTERVRLGIEAYERQKVDDWNKRMRSLQRQAVKDAYQSQKAEAAAVNRDHALLGLAKEIPTSQIDNRPGEKFALRRTKGMARKKDPTDTAGSSP